MDNIYYISEFVTERETLISDGIFQWLGLSNIKSKKRLLTFLEDRKYINEINDNKDISCVVCKQEFLDELDRNHIKGVVISDTPRLFYFSLHNHLASDDKYALANYKTQIGEHCSISHLAYIDSENVTIGNNVKIEEFVSIRGHCSIGDNVVIHSGVQIGASGYEFKKNGETFYMVEHCGETVVENDVVIWPNATVHKAVYPWDQTKIGAYSKINSQSHIDHGVKIGLRCEICAGVTISGRVEIDDYSFIGPGAVISNRIKIGKNAKVSLGSVVTKDVLDDAIVTGNFAISHEKFLGNLKRKVQ